MAKKKDDILTTHRKLVIKTVLKSKPGNIITTSQSSDYDKGYADGFQEGVEKFEESIKKLFED